MHIANYYVDSIIMTTCICTDVTSEPYKVVSHYIRLIRDTSAGQRLH